MKKLAIQEINETIRLTLDGVPICEMLGTHRQKVERAQFLKSAGNYKLEKKERRDQERLAEEQIKRFGGMIPKHRDLGGGVHLLAFGIPTEGSVLIQTSDPFDLTADYRQLATLTREEALEWVEHLNQPELMREVYRKLIDGKHLTGEEVSR